MEPAYDLIIHEEYGISLESTRASQPSTNTPKIENVAGVVSLALAFGVSIITSSGNAGLERTGLAAGASSTASVFKLQRKLAELDSRGAAYGGKLVVSKHVPKAYVEAESRRYDALVRDLLFLSHPPIQAHDNFVNILAIGWEDSEATADTRIWPVLVLEFAEYGTLEDYLGLDDTDKSWETKRSICEDVASGLSWLHQCRIIHSDVKFGNVLVFENSDPNLSSPYRAKLSDFGFALNLAALEASGREIAMLEGFTPPCAPEAGLEIPLGLLTKIDVFSYGLLAGRLFLDGDKVFGQKPEGDWEDLAGEFYSRCVKLGLPEDPRYRLIRNLVASTTSAEAASRVEMEDALRIISSSRAEETMFHSTATPVAGLDQIATVPEIEEVWALNLSSRACYTIVSDLRQVLQDYETKHQHENMEQQRVAAKVAYQLYLAQLVGYGCEKSDERAIRFLQSSARLGYQDARDELYAAQMALSIDVTTAKGNEIKQWLSEAAIRGDQSCLQELRTLDEGAYRAVVTSTARRKAMCEQSGFMFDDEFIKMNNDEELQELLSAAANSGEPIDEDIGGGLTWLHYAVFTSSLGLATSLVNINFPINVQNEKGQTPLWISCLSGNYEMSSFLLSQDADASIESDGGSSPLYHLAVFEDAHAEKIALMLLEHGANVNGRNAAGYTPLHYAVRGSGNLDEGPGVAVLLNSGGNPLIPDEDGDTALDSAIYTMRISALEEILASQFVRELSEVELNKILASAFGNWIRQMKHHRLRSGSLHYYSRIKQLVHLLHTDDIVPIYMANHLAGYSPLHDAYNWLSDDLAAEIVKLPNAGLNELDGGEYGYTPLMIAIRTSEPAAIESLIEAGADPVVRARTGENVIHQCVQYQPTLLPYMCDQIEKLHGDVALMCNQANLWKGETPLDYAIYLGQSKWAQFLLTKGANPTYMRESPENGGLRLNSLRCCLFPPSVRMFELLLQHMEPESFVCVSDGRNLLHLACMHIYDEAKSGDSIIASFVNAVITKFPKAINSAFGRSSMTPLHLAAAFGNVTAVKILLRRGANPFAKSASGSTPLEEITDISNDDSEIVDKYGHVVRGIMRERIRTRWRDTRQILRQAMDLTVGSQKIETS